MGDWLSVLTANAIPLLLQAVGFIWWLGRRAAAIEQRATRLGEQFEHLAEAVESVKLKLEHMANHDWRLNAAEKEIERLKIRLEK